jgi:16S rRNA processing protein RimM
MKRRRQAPPESPVQDPTTGSPSEGGPVFLAIGQLRRTHGIEGEMLMEILTDFPERLRSGKSVFIGEEHEPAVIAGLRKNDQTMLIRFSGYQNPEQAARLRNQYVYIKAASLPKLPEGQYYHHQLIGLTIVNESGQSLGKLSEILETGANDVYVVKADDGKELLLPAIEDVILKVDLERGEMTARPPDWL